MPIYAYKCGSCGHAKDVLQKLSDKPLSVCPACGAEAFTKQVTAAGFQLKGSGWYVTDFRGGNTNKGGSDSAPGDAGAESKSDSKGESKPESKSESSAPAPSVDAPKKEATSASPSSASGTSSSSSSSSSSS